MNIAAQLKALFCVFVGLNPVEKCTIEHEEDKFVVKGEVVPQYELITRVIMQDEDLVESLLLHIEQLEGLERGTLQSVCGRVNIDNEPYPLARLLFIKLRGDTWSYEQYMEWLNTTTQEMYQEAQVANKLINSIAALLTDKAVSIGNYAISKGSISFVKKSIQEQAATLLSSAKAQQNDAITQADYLSAMSKVFELTPQQMSENLVKDFHDRDVNAELVDAKLVMVALPENTEGDITLSLEDLMVVGSNSKGKSMTLRIPVLGPALIQNIIGDTLLEVQEDEDALRITYYAKFIAYALTRISLVLKKAIDAAEKEKADE